MRAEVTVEQIVGKNLHQISLKVFDDQEQLVIFEDSPSTEMTAQMIMVTKDPAEAQAYGEGPFIHNLVMNRPDELGALVVIVAPEEEGGGGV